MSARSQSRITTACNSCRLRKQKWKPCIQCLDHRRTCNWPEQQKRGPPKGYIEALERRLQETESILLGLLDQVSDSQLSGIPHSTDQLLSGKRGSEYWSLFPLRSVKELRSWQKDCRRSAPDRACTATPDLDPVEVPTLDVADAPVVQEEEVSRRPHQSPELQPQPQPQPSLSVWSGAPSANFQQRFLW